MGTIVTTLKVDETLWNELGTQYPRERGKIIRTFIEALITNNDPQKTHTQAKEVRKQELQKLHGEIAERQQKISRIQRELDAIKKVEEQKALQQKKEIQEQKQASKKCSKCGTTTKKEDLQHHAGWCKACYMSASRTEIMRQISKHTKR
jgi:formylmethanofuran dehydrogenase subunit E